MSRAPYDSNRPETATAQCSGAYGQSPMAELSEFPELLPPLLYDLLEISLRAGGEDSGNSANSSRQSRRGVMTRVRSRRISVDNRPTSSLTCTPRCDCGDAA